MAVKSVNQRMLEGHPNQQLLKPNMVAEGKPQKPDGLDEYGNWMWEQCVEPLIADGVVAAIDQSALVSLCKWWSRFVQAEAKLDACDDISTTGASRAMNYVSKCFDHYRRLCAKFGLTPQDRNNITSGDFGGENPADKFLN